MPDRLRSRSTVRTAVVWRVLRDAISGLEHAHVLDAGGGTGGFAVPLAQLGHTVTVVDPSPDSLAAFERRAAEADVSGQVRAVQGDAADLLDVVEPEQYDAVLGHSVLEVVEDAAAAVAAMARALRPGGVLSLLTANRVAAVFHRAAAGRLAEARRLLADPAGRAGDNDPLARRFTCDELVALVAAAGLHPAAMHGVRVFADSVPAALLDMDPDAVDDLVALEEAAAEIPAYRAVATQLHLLARRD